MLIKDKKYYLGSIRVKLYLLAHLNKSLDNASKLNVT